MCSFLRCGRWTTLRQAGNAEYKVIRESNNGLKKLKQELPASPVVRTWCFSLQGPGFDPLLEN